MATAVVPTGAGGHRALRDGAGQPARQTKEDPFVTTSEIKVRNPNFDFTDAEVVWGPNAEAVIGMDAGSPIITPIEIFLVKVMRVAKAQLDPVKDAELIRDIDLFNPQEVRHYKTHAAFNKLIREWCPEVAPIEQAYLDEMNAFVAEKP